MSKSFYANDEDQSTYSDEPLVPSVIKTSADMRASTLSNGNQILQSLQLTETLHQWRDNVINQLNSAEAEWGTQKSAVSNEIASAREYLEKNIFTDTYENRELLVSSSILSLGAFFSGRVLSNRANWGNKSVFLKPRISIVGKLFTSLPSRIFLPFALAGSVFHKITPVSSRNFWKTLEKDVLPVEFVSTYQTCWRNYYDDGFLKKKEQFYCDINKYLQGGVRSLRESINNRSKD